MFKINRNKKIPIVFVHGIFGAMGEGILKGSGELHFGIAEDVYRPIINILESFGYKEGRDLFISYYDWTKKCEDSTKNYLIPTIKKAKQISRSKKVNIIAHSMGGIVARSYAQSESYKNDIDKLIMIGTPNAGAANAYFFWSGGDYVSRDPYKNTLYTLIKSTYIWYMRFKYKKDIDMEFIREKIPSIEELLPSYEYGNYLLSENEKQEIDIETMSIQNKTLHNLNVKQDILRARNIKTYLLVGKGIETTDKITIIKGDKEDKKWVDGKPVGIIKTSSGDGTVKCDSVDAVDGKVMYIDSDHGEILSNCKRELAYILNVRRAMFISKENNFDIIYILICKDVDVTFSQEEKKKFKFYDLEIKKISTDIELIVIKKTDKYKTEIDVANKYGQGKLVIIKANLSERSVEEKIVNIRNKISMQI